MTAWIPTNDPPPPDDHHTWARPAPEACPDCDCCSARLCALAIEKRTACHWEGRSGDFDLAECPCWQKQPSPRYPRGKALR